MATQGKLEKMLILGFKDSKEAENGGKSEAIKNNAYFEALINPETYTLDYKLKFSESGQGQGTSGKQLKYEYTEPEEITFEFLFDNTGIIDGEPRENIADDIRRFKQILVDYQGDSPRAAPLQISVGQKLDFQRPCHGVEHHLQAVQPRRKPHSGGCQS